MAVSDVSQKYDVILRIFEISKYQNILTFTVLLIVPITSLIHQNHQLGRFAAKHSETAEIAFCPFWSNVTVFVAFSILFFCFCFAFLSFCSCFCPPCPPPPYSYQEIFSSFLKKLWRYDRKVCTFPLNRITGTLEWACSPELCQVGSTP